MTTESSGLQWMRHEHIVGVITAVGCRGVYNIQQIGPVFSLQGVGHDDLPIYAVDHRGEIALPAEGKVFVYLVDAQRYAATLDARMLAESQAGGE